MQVDERAMQDAYELGYDSGMRGELDDNGRADAILGERYGTDTFESATLADAWREGYEDATTTRCRGCGHIIDSPADPCCER
jgi:hypothetical protein